MSNQLVFLISQPRSGSTLLQAILGSHPEVHTTSEPWIALPFVYALKKEGSEFEFIGSWAKDAIKAFFDDSGIDKEDYNGALNIFLMTFYKKALSNSGKSIFLDKTPRYYEISSELINIFPEAKFIVLYRNPLSVLNSILKTWVRDKPDILYYYYRDLFEAPKKLIDFAGSQHNNICLVRYEELVRSPNLEIERICDFVGVPYMKEIINYTSDRDWAFGDKNFKGKSVPDIGSIDAWKSNLQEGRTLNFYYYYLRELGEEIVNALGYDFESLMGDLSSRNPSEKDLELWKTLLANKYIVSVEEQRQQVRATLEVNPLKAFFRRIIS